MSLNDAAQNLMETTKIGVSTRKGERLGDLHAQSMFLAGRNVISSPTSLPLPPPDYCILLLLRSGYPLHIDRRPPLDSKS